MKKRLLLPFLFLAISLSLSAASAVNVKADEGFDSEENLALFDFSDETGLNNDWLDEVTISLVTQAPGDQVYIWFGHAGLMISTPDNEIMYDWGVFSFGPGFYTDFLFGRLYYSTIARWADSSIMSAAAEDRTVRSLTLPLDNAAKRAVIDFVNYNIKRENSTYLYHYYLDNCATRIRDIINSASGGAFRTWAESIDTGMSFRDLSSLYMDRSMFVSFVLNYLQSGEIDQNVSLYEACFLPDVLLRAAAAFYDVQDTVIYQGRPEGFTGRSLLAASLVSGLAAAIILYTLAHVSRRAYGIVSFFFWLFFFVLSSVLLFMMCFTTHDVTWHNENIIFLNPGVIIFLINAVMLIFSKKAKLDLSISAARVMLTLALSDIVLKGLFPEAFIQDNFSVLAFIIPVYTAISCLKKEGKRHV